MIVVSCSSKFSEAAAKVSHLFQIRLVFSVIVFVLTTILLQVCNTDETRSEVCRGNE